MTRLLLHGVSLTATSLSSFLLCVVLLDGADGSDT
jgi:hypothetical protein